MIYCVDQLTKSFGKHTALRNLCVEISEPGIYGILGPNGAGKSTFIKLMLKILTPSSGNIYYNGKNIEHAGNDYFRNIGAVLEGNRKVKSIFVCKLPSGISRIRRPASSPVPLQ